MTKRNAHKFWTDNFGFNTLIIPYNRFLNTYCAEFSPLGSKWMASSFKEHVDLTKSEHISIFTFDIFVRLFAPWNHSRQVWEILAYKHTAFKSHMIYDEVADRLGDMKVGSYIYRLSATRVGQWAIGYTNQYGHVLQTLPQKQNLAEALIEGISDKRYAVI